MAANLDLNDKLVRRGLLVSWHGWRATVQRVRMGRCLLSFAVDQADATVKVPPSWVPCSAVQVVR
jgi:hypothetical protein